MDIVAQAKRKIFKTLYDITGNDIHKGVFLKGFLIPSKGIYEIWFPYSIEVAKLLKPGIFLAVKNFASIGLTDNKDKLGKPEEHYSVLEVIDVDIVHYKIKELSENPQDLLLGKEFEKFMGEWYRHAYEPEKKTLKIIVKAVIHDEELVICTPERAVELGQETIFFKETNEPPISGEKVFILESKYLNKFINGDLEKRELSFKAGKHKIYRNIDVYIDQEPLFNRHFSIFGFTGSGKSNLVSTLVYKSLLKTKYKNNNPNNILIFDINNEYFGLLFDVLLQIDGAIVFLDSPGGNLDAFFRGSITKETIEGASRELVERTTLPRALSNREFKEKLFSIAKLLLLTGKVRIFTREVVVLEVIKLLEEIFSKINFGGQGSKQKKEILMSIFSDVVKYLKSKGLLDLTFNSYISSIILTILTSRHGSLLKEIDDLTQEKNHLVCQLDSSKAKTAFKERIKGIESKIKILNEIISKLDLIINQYNNLSNEFLDKEKYVVGGTSLQELILKTHDNTSSLFIFTSEDDNNMRNFAYEFGNIVYKLRKNGHVLNTPQIVFILEEADLFIPSSPSGSKEEKASIENSKRIATMIARRGRKYNLGLAIATQRVTYLDTNITSQLATYFVSKLPKRTDREKVAEAFGIEPSILNQTLSFLPGEWMVLTHADSLYRKAVPVTIKFENANDRLIRILTSISCEDIEKLIGEQFKVKSSNSPSGDMSKMENIKEEIFASLPQSEDLSPIFVE